jgi:hypothetical protein
MVLNHYTDDYQGYHPALFFVITVLLARTYPQRYHVYFVRVVLLVPPVPFRLVLTVRTKPFRKHSVQECSSKSAYEGSRDTAVQIMMVRLQEKMAGLRCSSV